MDKVVAVIPARGGSKRLPRKNIIPFCGHPMLAWTVNAALETGLFERVIVSTEDDEIADVALAVGAQVDKRCVDLANDSTRVADVCLDLLEREQKAGRHYDVLCCLYATAPLRNTNDIVSTVDLVRTGKADFAVAVTQYDLPPHQALKRKGDGVMVPMWQDLVNKRAEEIGDLVVDNGSTYAVRVPVFLDNPVFFGEPLAGHVMPRERSIDIDEKEDLEMALYQAKNFGLGES